MTKLEIAGLALAVSGLAVAMAVFFLLLRRRRDPGDEVTPAETEARTVRILRISRPAETLDQTVVLPIPPVVSRPVAVEWIPLIPANPAERTPIGDLAGFGRGLTLDEQIAAAEEQATQAGLVTR